MRKEKRIVNYSIENIRAGERSERHFDFFPFEYFARDIEHLKQSHRHEFHAFILVTAGSGSHVVDFVEYPILPWRCFYISLGQIHAWKTLKQVKGYILLFTDDFYNRLYTGHSLIKSDRFLQDLQVYTDIPKALASEWLRLFKEVEHEYSKKSRDWELVICLLLKTLVLRLRRLHGETFSSSTLKHRQELIGHYRELINEHFLKLKTPRDYADLLNITANYLSGVCKEVTGKPAGQLIRERIILEAKRLILHTPLTISEITHQLGFNDKSHFGKYFKTSTGTSPDKFRQEFKNNVQ